MLTSFTESRFEEFPAQIAQTALWLMDHQMNMLVSEEFGSLLCTVAVQKIGNHHSRQRPAN